MMYTMKPLTYSEAADCVREANAIASGLRLDEVEAMLRSRARPDPECQPKGAEALRLLQASSCFRGEVCAMLPCACAETLDAANAALRAKVDGLTAALGECVDVFELVEHPCRVDPDYGSEVNALGQHIGFGALMSSASASWRASLAAKGNPVGGEFVAGPCQGTITRVLEIARKALALNSEHSDGEAGR